jgi:hypothetical protein
MKTALVALTTAGLLAAGAAAYADDDMTMVQGGKGGFALSGGNDANHNQATSGDVNPNPVVCGEEGCYGGPYVGGGSADNTQVTNCYAAGSAASLLAAIQGVNVCPNVGPILSKQEGGDATGGDSETGDVEQNNNASSSASANGGSAYVGEGKATPAKEKKAKKRHRKNHRRH